MIKIICVGKLKEKYLIELVNDYKNRVNKYHKLEIIELKDSNKNEEGLEINKYINKYRKILLKMCQFLSRRIIYSISVN